MQAKDTSGFNWKWVGLQTQKHSGKVFYAIRLSSKLSRRTIGVGNDKLVALNIGQLIDDQIDQWIEKGQEIDLDLLKRLARQELDQVKNKTQNLRVVEKDDLIQLWNEYVNFHLNLGCWEETYILTHIQTVGNLIKRCPHQKLENKTKIVDWFFNTDKRSVKTSKARFQLVVAVIDWASKQALIPRYLGVEYRDILSSIHTKTNEQEKGEDIGSKEIDIFTVSEVYKILEALKTEKVSRFKGKHYQYYHYTYFLWLTGCRPSEAVALKWENVDLQRQKIIFKEGEVIASGKRVKKKGTKTVYQRIFPINNELEIIIKSIPKTGNNGYVFVILDGKPVSQQAYVRMWKGLLNKLEIRYRIPYQLRHTMISYHANNDFPVHKLAKLVGNSEKVINDHYLQLDIERISLPGVIKGNEVSFNN
ncbi:MAG: site-specific integrase [Lyngbya sp.]|nr:site-specific integrase [Lyngbya sp.]